MRTLSKILKDIYTEGDRYTVLQLLNKIIEAVEEYEEEGITIAAPPLYRHRYTIKKSGYDSIEEYYDVYDDSPDNPTMTPADVLKYFEGRYVSYMSQPGGTGLNGYINYFNAPPTNTLVLWNDVSSSTVVISEPTVECVTTKVYGGLEE